MTANRTVARVDSNDQSSDRKISHGEAKITTTINEPNYRGNPEKILCREIALRASFSNELGWFIPQAPSWEGAAHPLTCFVEKNTF